MSTAPLTVRQATISDVYPDPATRPDPETFAAIKAEALKVADHETRQLGGRLAPWYAPFQIGEQRVRDRRRQAESEAVQRLAKLERELATVRKNQAVDLKTLKKIAQYFAPAERKRHTDSGEEIVLPVIQDMIYDDLAKALAQTAQGDGRAHCQGALRPAGHVLRRHVG